MLDYESSTCCFDAMRYDVTTYLFMNLITSLSLQGYEGSFLKLISSKPGKPPQVCCYVQLTYIVCHNNCHDTLLEFGTTCSIAICDNNVVIAYNAYTSPL